MSEWSTELVQRIADEFRRARNESRPRRSVQWVADRTAELGHPMSRSAISDLELGRKRSLDVPELVVLAEALGVPALQLIYPAAAHETVEFMPGRTQTTQHAAQRFAGMMPAGMRIRYDEEPNR